MRSPSIPASHPTRLKPYTPTFLADPGARSFCKIHTLALALPYTFYVLQRNTEIAKQRRLGKSTVFSYMMAAIGSLVFCTACGNLLDGSSGNAKAILVCEVCGTENTGEHCTEGREGNPDAL